MNSLKYFIKTQNLDGSITQTYEEYGNDKNDQNLSLESVFDILFPDLENGDVNYEQNEIDKYTKEN